MIDLAVSRVELVVHMQWAMHLVFRFEEKHNHGNVRAAIKAFGST